MLDSPAKARERAASPSDNESPEAVSRWFQAVDEKRRVERKASQSPQISPTACQTDSPPPSVPKVQQYSSPVNSAASLKTASPVDKQALSTNEPEQFSSGIGWDDDLPPKVDDWDPWSDEQPRISSSSSSTSVASPEASRQALEPEIVDSWDSPAPTFCKTQAVDWENSSGSVQPLVQKQRTVSPQPLKDPWIAALKNQRKQAQSSRGGSNSFNSSRSNSPNSSASSTAGWSSVTTRKESRIASRGNGRIRGGAGSVWGNASARYASSPSATTLPRQNENPVKYAE